MRRVPSPFFLHLLLLVAAALLAAPVVAQNASDDDNSTQEAAGLDPDDQRTAGGPWPFDSGTMWKDDVYVVTVNETGTFRYGCLPHPQMRALVEVHEEAPPVSGGTMKLAARDLHFGTWDGSDPRSYQVGTRVAVPPGTVIEWTNLDRVTHTVTSDINWGLEEQGLPASSAALTGLVLVGVTLVLAARRDA